MTASEGVQVLISTVFVLAFTSFSFAQTPESSAAPHSSNAIPAALVLRALRANRVFNGNSFPELFSDAAVESSSPASGNVSIDPGASTQGQRDPQPNAQGQAPSNPQAPSLEDLGLSPEQTKGNPQLQARLDRRTHMLKIHQRLGLITAIPMIATVATSFGAGGRATSTSDRWAHLALGSMTTGLYFTAAAFAIRAPGIAGTKRRGPIRVHRALAWIHGPGMILTPILGAIAFDQKSKGEKVHGIASAHGPVAIVTAGAFGAALLSVSLKF
ncbi:MAG TPA: hypothetical protein VFB23_07750 [Candidatus Acidoferrales bacterium]|jgi:hypothetical protein|nr:hypothetical protein [Candidatus Acidoferrales bacterium]